MKSKIIIIVFAILTMLAGGNMRGEKKEVPEEKDISENHENIKKSNPEKEPVKMPKIAIDAGHQLKGNYEKESQSPGSKIMKAKVSSGTRGVLTGIPEYQFNLEISILLKKALEDKGYEVFMIREENEVDISNQERAKMANESGSDIYIRIHANGIDNKKVEGVEVYYASEKNPDVGRWSKDSEILSKEILRCILEETRAKDRGVHQRDDLTGTNFSNIPTTLLELGYMSNPEEDKKLADPQYREKLVRGIVRGIEGYFSKKDK